MKAKELGDYAELKFQLLSFKKGFVVSKPYGDNSRYDFIVDFDGILARVQIRATASKGGKGYRFSNVYGKNKGLDKSNIDYLAAYILSEDIWYIIPISIIKNSKTIRINPNSKNDKFIQYKDRWAYPPCPSGPGRPSRQTSTPALRRRRNLSLPTRCTVREQ